MNNSLQKRIQDEVNRIIDEAADVKIVSNVPFDDMQLALLQELNYFSAVQTLYDEEVQKDPRKILYKTNQNFKKALVALCLTQVLINKRSKGYYTKEYFEENIDVKTVEKRTKQVNFGRCENEEIIGAINVEKAFDWILYCQGRGIDAFVAEKTDCRGLEGFVPGASKTYEFARFERLHNEEQRRKQAIEKERLQQEFKQSFMKELAVGLAQQQIENNSANVLDIVSSLFQKENYSNAIEKILDNHLLEKQQENLIDERVKVYDKVEQTREVSQKLLTDNSNNYANAFFQFVKQQNEHQR